MMKRKFKRLIHNKRLMASLAAFLFASDLVITMMAGNVDFYNANAATTGYLSSMKERAEAIVNYEWTPVKDLKTWNNSKYKGLTTFPAGKTVKGVPFCLFTSEVVKRSQLTLNEFKPYASTNYSTTAICRSVHNKSRTGPVYGSCCASFVSEVMGGKWMGINVNSIATNPQASHITNAYAKQIKVGDAIDKGSHIIWIGDITDEYYVIYEQTPPVAHKVLLKKSAAVNSAGRFYYNCNSYTRITRFNLQNTNLTVTAPKPYSTSKYYAENATATVKWPLVKNASYYLIDVLKDKKSIVSGKAVLNNSFDINNGNGNYEVYVTAVCGSNKKKSGCVAFSIGRLDTPVISNSTDCYESGTKVSINWNACTGATGYTVYMSKDDTANFIKANVKTNSYTFSPEDGYYEAYVEAKNDNGGLQKTTSKKYSFFVGNKRRISIDSSVVYFAHDGDVNLKWTDCEGVTDYTLNVFSGSNPVLETAVSENSSYTVKNLPDGYYTAVVSAVESKGEFEWMPSKEFGFYVGKLDRPVVAAESKYYALNSKATVSWKKCTGAVNYKITVTSDDGVVLDETYSGTTCSFNVRNGKYRVKVSSVNTNGGIQQCAGKEIDVWAVSIEINNPVSTMKPGKSVTFSATVSDHDPADAVKWSSSVGKVLTIASDGKATAKNAGATVVKASLGKYAVSCPVSVVPDLSYETLGASIRLTEPYGIRFGMRLEKDNAFKSTEIIEYGTLIIGAGTLDNKELTLNTPNILRIKADNFLENTSGHIVYTGVLINIPKSFFNTPVVGRGYLKYRGADGKDYVLYSTKVEKTFNGVVTSAYENYQKIQNPNPTQVSMLKKLKTLYAVANPKQDETTAASSSVVEQTTTVASAAEQPATEPSSENASTTAGSSAEPTVTTVPAADTEPSD